MHDEMGLELGRDYQWTWSENHWAIEFHDPRMETAVRLKVQFND
jgi:hypothetical protein